MPLLDHYEDLLRNPDLTPSARVLEQMQSQDQEYLEWGIAISQQHVETLLNSPANELDAELAERTQASMVKLQALEQDSHEQIDFGHYLRQYERLKTPGLMSH